MLASWFLACDVLYAANQTAVRWTKAELNKEVDLCREDFRDLSLEQIGLKKSQVSQETLDQLKKSARFSFCDCLIGKTSQRFSYSEYSEGSVNDESVFEEVLASGACSLPADLNAMIQSNKREQTLSSPPNMELASSRFEVEGIIIADRLTNRLWTAIDTGVDTIYLEAKRTCDKLAAQTGFQWRLPLIAELETLLDSGTTACGRRPSAQQSSVCKVHSAFKLTGPFLWSSEVGQHSTNAPAHKGMFMDTKRPAIFDDRGSAAARALCVLDGSSVR